MATKRKVSQKNTRTEKRAEKPVTRIQEAAERAAGAKAVNAPSRDDFATWLAKEKEAGDFPITLTLGELCDIIAYDITPSDFASSALIRLAEDFDVLSDIIEHRDLAGFESWKTMQGMRSRMEFAARVVSELKYRPAVVS